MQGEGGGGGGEVAVEEEVVEEEVVEEERPIDPKSRRNWRRGRGGGRGESRRPDMALSLGVELVLALIKDLCAAAASSPRSPAAWRSTILFEVQADRGAEPVSELRGAGP